METLAIICLVPALIFFLLGLIFARFKEKACSLISGYNFKSKKQRELYDEKRLSADMRNLFFIYSGIFLVGSIATLWWGHLCFWMTWIIWLILFFKDVHFDDEKAFGKYKK